jgi:hypothetical protein
VTWVMWKVASIHLETVNLGEIGARFVLNVPWAWKSFWAYPMELLGNVGQIAHFSPFGGSVNLDIR